MIKGKMAELLALGIIASAVDNHSKDKSPLHGADGEINPIGALAGLGKIVGDGFKDMPDETKTPEGVPNLSKEFHKMGVGLELMGFAVDLGLIKGYTQEQRTATFVSLETLKAKLEHLSRKIETQEEKLSLQVRREKGILAVGDYFYTAETGDEIQQLQDEDRKDFFYNLGFTHATDEQIEAHLKKQG